MLCRPDNRLETPEAALDHWVLAIESRSSRACQYVTVLSEARILEAYSRVSELLPCISLGTSLKLMPDLWIYLEEDIHLVLKTPVLW